MLASLLGGYTGLRVREAVDQLSIEPALDDRMIGPPAAAGRWLLDRLETDAKDPR